MPPKLRVTGDLAGTELEQIETARSGILMIEIVSRLNKQAHENRVATFISCIGSKVLEIKSTTHYQLNLKKTR